MTTILAIDTATGPCSVALWNGGDILAYVENLKPAMQSASLMPMVEEALEKSKMEYKDIGLVACTIGPGSFTGIRVGLAAARGIAFAAGIKTAGFTTLEVLAYGARADNKSILAILNAGKGEYYYQTFCSPLSGEAGRGALSETHVATASYHNAPTLPLPLRGREYSLPCLGTLESALALAGNDAIIAGNAPGAGGITFPRADLLAQLAATSSTTQELRPFYIRPPDAKLPKVSS